MTLILIVLILLCITKWIKWYISTLVLLYYLEKEQYKLPTSIEVKAYTALVIKKLIKDLICFR